MANIQKYTNQKKIQKKIFNIKEKPDFYKVMSINTKKKKNREY